MQVSFRVVKQAIVETNFAVRLKHTVENLLNLSSLIDASSEYRPALEFVSTRGAFIIGSLYEYLSETGAQHLSSNEERDTYDYRVAVSMVDEVRDLLGSASGMSDAAARRGCDVKQLNKALYNLKKSLYGLRENIEHYGVLKPNVSPLATPENA